MVFVCRLLAFCLALLVLNGGPFTAGAAVIGEKSNAKTESSDVLNKQQPGKPTRTAEKSPAADSKQARKTAARPPSLRKMVGQMLMLGFPGTKPEQKGPKEARRLLRRGDIGGLIFMGENMESKAQVRDLVTFIKSGQDDGKPVPFIGIDQEGGKVQRLNGRHGFTDIPTARAVAGLGSIEAARQTYGRLANELQATGFNVNFGPVVDLDLVPNNPIIGAKERSYGKDPATVRRYARAFVMAHRHRNMLTALKHFPGHGSSWTDSHEQFVDLTSSWRRLELKPYQSMVRDGLVDFVMVGHLFHPDFTDGEKLPASLSRKAIEGNLRGKIGYDGLVITDDLGMNAVKKYVPFERAVVRAVNAGNDILLLAAGNPATSKNVNRIHRIIARAVKAGRINPSTIRRSYERIVAVKKRLATDENKGL